MIPFQPQELSVREEGSALITACTPMYVCSSGIGKREMISAFVHSLTEGWFLLFS